jgi:hypothetical protein
MTPTTLDQIHTKTWERMPWHARAKVAARLEQEIRNLTDRRNRELEALASHQREIANARKTARRLTECDPVMVRSRAKAHLAEIGPDPDAAAHITALLKAMAS